eukprot:2657115-Lingulodinium_polyedra.AAC.1
MVEAAEDLGNSEPEPEEAGEHAPAAVAESGSAGARQQGGDGDGQQQRHGRTDAPARGRLTAVRQRLYQRAGEIAQRAIQ